MRIHLVIKTTKMTMLVYDNDLVIIFMKNYIFLIYLFILIYLSLIFMCIWIFFSSLQVTQVFFLLSKLPHSGQCRFVSRLWILCTFSFVSHVYELCLDQPEQPTRLQNEACYSYPFVKFKCICYFPMGMQEKILGFEPPIFFHQFKRKRNYLPTIKNKKSSKVKLYFLSYLDNFTTFCVVCG